LFGERAPDVLGGIDHLIRLGLAGGVAPIVTEAGTLQELRELPGLGVCQSNGDLDEVLVLHDAQPSVRLDVAPARIDLSLDAPREAAVLEEACQLQGAVELIQASSKQLMALRAEGGIEDPLGSRREDFQDVVKVLHGVLSCLVVVFFRSLSG
jgi:hypothetical protein